MNFKQDANSMSKLSKEKWLSLDVHAETIGVIFKTRILGMMSGERRRATAGCNTSLTSSKKWTTASLEENVRVTEDRTAWHKRSCASWSGYTSELTMLTKVKQCIFGVVK